MNVPFLTLDRLRPKEQMFYHQHALTYMSSSSRKNCPTQLVYPDRSVSLGFPPTSLETSISSGAARSASQNAQQQQEMQARNQAVIVYGTATDRATIKPVVEALAYRLFMLAAFQLVAVVARISGTSFIHLFGDIEDDAASEAVRTGIYISILVCHILPSFALLFWRREPLLLYRTCMAVFGLVGSLLALRCLLDAVVFGLCLCLYAVSHQAAQLFGPRAFSVLK
eukprot:GDKH01023541.1.p1 GENE.GDKH01023541.1~~GDKH01023541.1.p1  ORF type:complete len:225 (+),score=6.01 GDKH01023541.1:132-806(+)